MYTLASTSKQSLLDLINKDNNTAFTLTAVSLSNLTKLEDSDFVAKLETTNSVVQLNNAKDATDVLKIGYQRLPAEGAFGDDPVVRLVSDGQTNYQILTQLRTNIAQKWGMPMEQGSHTATLGNGTAVIDFSQHFVLMGSETFSIIDQMPLSAVVEINSTTEFFTADDKSDLATSADYLLQRINDLNNTSLRFDQVTFSSPAALGNKPSPHDQIDIIPVADGQYGLNVTFAYDRLDIETLSPNGVDLEDFATFTAFYNTVTPAYMAPILTQLYGVPVRAEELKVRSQTNNGDTFTAKVAIVDNYILRSAGGITVTSKKTTT